MSTQPELCASGALPAYYEAMQGLEMQETSFFTALGCFALDAFPNQNAFKPRMLDFLERCESPDRPGSFFFWPPGDRPDWAQTVPPDSDDTALCLTLLHGAGRRTRAETIRQAATRLLPNRQPFDAMAPSWIATGAFRTWLTDDRDRPNAVDCAVNANILALFATLDVRDVPGRAAAIQTIARGVAWAGRDAARLHALTPFYPEPRELVLALQRAVEAGVAELRAPLAALHRVVNGTPPPNAVLCAGAYLSQGWQAPALHALRTADAPSKFSQRETCKA